MNGKKLEDQFILGKFGYEISVGNLIDILREMNREIETLKKKGRYEKV